VGGCVFKKDFYGVKSLKGLSKGISRKVKGGGLVKRYFFLIKFFY
jgi:hypothetical protein